MDAEKRSLGISDYSGDIRKGGRGGPMSYRPALSKEAAPGDSGSYYDKVMPSALLVFVLLVLVISRWHFILCHSSLYPLVILLRPLGLPDFSLSQPVAPPLHHH